MVVPLIKNRKELRKVLENSLVLPEEEERLVDKKPKTFIIESNMGGNLNFNKESPIQTNIIDTEDTTLKKLKLITKDNKILEFYLDISDKRFWLLHSLEEASLSSRVVHKLVDFNPSLLDFPWFSSTALEEIGSFGKETGFNLKFENEFLENGDEDYEENLKQISMRFWGGRSNDILKDLKENNKLSKGIALSSLDLKYKEETGYVKEKINYNGKFVAIKGNSIDSHFNLINKIKKKYSNFLSKIEDEYRMNYEKTNLGFKINGSYTLIEFKREIEDLKLFADILTSCSKPFRLWGVWDFLDEDYIKIKGIDLHTMHKVNIELTKNWMRIFLPIESCGNVIARIFTNLQRHFDSNITLRGNEDDKIE